MKIDQFQGNSNCEKSMKARTNLRPSMESLMPGLQFEKKNCPNWWKFGLLVTKMLGRTSFWDTLYIYIYIYTRVFFSKKKRYV